MRTLLIDGDILIFQAASANEYETQWDDWLWTLHADLGAAIQQLTDKVDQLVADLESDDVIFALTDPVNWRKAIMPDYKHNRVSKRKPVIYKAMREYVAETYTTFQRPTLEGDDVLGILATHPTLIAGEKIIVSLDKDMLTLPGQVLNDGKARAAMANMPHLTYNDFVQTISPADADRQHMLQTLTGDVTDGYKGCPGIGPVKAEKILSAATTGYWPAVVATYAKAGLSEEVALQNARVARICRHTDYDLTAKAVIPWEPPDA